MHPPFIHIYTKQYDNRKYKHIRRDILKTMTMVILSI